MKRKELTDRLSYAIARCFRNPNKSASLFSRLAVRSPKRKHKDEQWHRIETLEPRMLLSADSIGSGSATGPTVDEVLIGGSTWTADIYNDLNANGLGDGGYAIPDGPAQFDPLGYGDINDIHVDFSADVVVGLSDFSLTGHLSGNIPAVAWGYNSTIQRLSIGFAGSLPNDIYTLTIFDTVTDANTGDALDGDWEDGITVGSSGDGNAGRSFEYQFYIMSGDATGDYTVDLADLAKLATNFGGYGLLPSVGNFTGDTVVDLKDLAKLATNFGNTLHVFDFGDAPQVYPTLLANNGAHHRIVPGFHLGNTVDGERNGLPSPGANRDDLSQPVDDEDGVTFLTPVISGGTAQVEVIASHRASIDAWMDTNQNGVWDPSEQIFNSQPVLPGSNILSFSVPAGFTGTGPGDAYTRFRYTRNGGTSPEGRARRGEVEDYIVDIEPNKDAEVHGTKWLDANGNGVRDANEPGLAGWTIYADLNGDGILNANEPSTVSMTDDPLTPNDDTGMYWLTVPAGNQVLIREVLQPGWEQTFPGFGVHVLQLNPGAVVDGIDFGNRPLEERLDWGDAPDFPYPTLAANNGAHHIIQPGFTLGREIDPESDGQPTVGADGDDNNPAAVDDEDGVKFITPLIPGSTATIEVEASAPGLLDAWIDFNINGVWEPAEQIFTSQPLAAGVNTLSFPVPANALPDNTYARFRLSHNGGLTPEGFGNEGEVEDYQIFIEKPTGEIHGTKWNDLNGNGERDPNEPGLAGVVIYSDLNNNGQRDAGEPSTVTMQDDPLTLIDETGHYWLVEIEPGEHVIREVVPDGFVQTFPFDGFHTVGLEPGQAVFDINFGNQPQEDKRFDWGDAPDGQAVPVYPTLALNNGAHHLIEPGFILGDAIDAEPNGQPSVGADRDDLNGAPDDEDGIIFTSALTQNESATVDVIAPQGGLLDAWVDFNGNGVWEPSEQIFTSEILNAGTTSLAFHVPFNAIPDNTYARFRLSHNGGLTPEGYGNEGEVEDYNIFIERGEPFIERDFYEGSILMYDITDPEGNTETITLTGLTQHNVYFEFAEGDAQDDDNNGRDEVQTEIVAMNLTGTSSLGPISVTLHPSNPSTGVFEEQINNTPGVLDVPPFTTSGQLDSFFDIWTETTIGTDTFYTNVPLRLEGTMTHKPAGPGDKLFKLTDDIVHIFDAAGNDTGFTVDNVCYIPFPKPPPQLDWGDAPDSYHTLAQSNGPRHEIDPNLYLGNRIDPDQDGQPDPQAYGDDLGDNSDDEDGLSFLSPLAINGQGDVAIVATGAGLLDGWLDFDQNGVFDPHEQIFTNYALNDGYNQAQFPVPANALPGETFLRLRYSHLGNLSPEGNRINQDGTESTPRGEVEDYRVFIEETVPDPVLLSVPVNWELNVQPASPGIGAGNDVDGSDFLLWQANGFMDVQFKAPVDPETGRTFALLLPAVQQANEGSTAPVPNTVPEGPNWHIETEILSMDLRGSYMDPNNENAIIAVLIGLLPPNENPFTNQGSSTGQIVAQNLGGGDFTVDSFFDIWVEVELHTPNGPMNLATNEALNVGMTFEPGDLNPDEVLDAPFEFWATDRANELVDLSPDHVLWDIIVDIHGEPSDNFDFGDAPDLPYNTLATNFGAVHKILDGFHLGDRVDGELNGQPSLPAHGDDTFDGIDDEDGVNFLTPLIPGADAEIEVIASEDGFLNAWIDFNENGTWEPSEKIASALLLTPGSNILTITVPVDARPSDDRGTYSRFRFSHVDVLPPEFYTSPDGFLPDGEVEDHLVRIETNNTAEVHGKKWDDLNGNGLHDNNEPGIADWEIEYQVVFDPGSDPFVGRISTMPDNPNTPDVDETGMYWITDIPTGQVTVTEIHQPGWVQTAPASGNYSFTIAAGEVVDGIDFGNRQIPGGNYYDWGDAPDSYSTVGTSGGPRHIIDSNLFLGNRVDIDQDGQPDPFALGDDMFDGEDDEDGLTLLNPLVVGGIGDIGFVASGPGLLDAWIDFNQNGFFDHPTEQIFSNHPLGIGFSQAQFPIPVSAQPGDNYMRIRYSHLGNLGPAGDRVHPDGTTSIPRGEVEDYHILIDGDFGEPQPATQPAQALIVNTNATLNNNASNTSWNHIDSLLDDDDDEVSLV